MTKKLTKDEAVEEFYTRHPKYRTKAELKKILDRIWPDNSELIKKVKELAIDETHEGFLEGRGTENEVKLSCNDCVGMMDRAIEITKKEVLKLLKGEGE